MESQGEAPKTTNVQVAVRCRPVNGEERRTAQATAIACDSVKKEVTVSSGPAGKKTSKTFTFDKVFGMYSTQEEVFETMVRPMVDEALAGFNTTIFAYGQTGTGKTHTMEGDINSEVDAGIVPRSVKAILETLEASGSEFTIRVSFLELYNEELQDLLVPPSSSSSSAPEKKLKLCEDVKKGVVCQNLEEVTVMGKDDIFEILQRGIKQRATAATLCNKNSSRSHSIFTMKIMIKECSVDGEEVVRHGQLNLVDLAGSECVGRSGAKNDRAKEAGSINQSLLTLGRVITALVDHHGHIPYRDSKLTRLLQESLGGKAKTCIIATLSPAAMAVEESMSTLDYAHRAKNIKNAPQLNQRMTKKVVLKEYCQEIETLRQQLQLTREKNGVYVDPNEYYAMEARIASQETQLLDCESALRMRNDEVKVLRADKDELGSQLGEAQKALSSTTAQLQSAESTLHVAQTELQHAQVEIAAHEAVIGEQTTTESTLTRVGGELQSEVSLRRGERDALLGKVDRLVACEAERLASASRFVGDVAASKRQLLGGVSSLLASNQQQSSELCDGVMQMLNKGKDTCATLTSAIDSALGVLIQDAEVAKDGMTASCGELQQHLRGTNASLAQSLQGMRQALSQWLGEVDSGIKAAVDQLAEQQRHVDATSEAVARQADSLTALAESFVAEQQAAGAQAVEATRAFQQDLAERLERHQETVAASTERARESVALKAAAMEKAMQSLLQDLVGDASADLASVASASSQLCRDARELGNTYAAAASTQQKATTDIANAHADALRSTAIAGRAAASEATEQTAVARQAAVAGLGLISTAVEGKRAQLNDTVSSVCAEAETAIEAGCGSVQRTSEAASAILVQVRAAAEGMNASASTAMRGFEAFLDTKGADVCAGVGSHFAVLGEHLAAQADGLEKLGAQVEAFGNEAAEAVVQPTGTTPKKVATYAALAELVATRPHNVIRDEARTGKVSAGASASAPAAEEPLPAAPAALEADGSSSGDLPPAPPAALEAPVAVEPATIQSKENAPSNVVPQTTRPSGLVKGALGSRSTKSTSAKVSTAAPLAEK